MNPFFNAITIIIALAGFVISLFALSLSKKEYDSKVNMQRNNKLKNRFLFLMHKHPNLSMGDIINELDVNPKLSRELFLEMQIDDRIIDTIDYPICNDTKWYIIKDFNNTGDN